jgi:hypothetical protein
VIDWLAIILYFGILLGWSPEAWSINVPQIAVSAFGAVLLVRQIARREPLWFHLDTVAIVLFVLWGPAQIAAGISVQTFETWNATLYWLMAATLYLSARTLMQSKAALERFLTVQVFAGTSLAIISVLLYFSTPMKVFFFFESRWAAYGPFIYKNQFAAFLELLMPVVLYRIIVDRKRRLAYIVVYAALFACMVTSLSRAGIVLAVLELLLFGFYCAIHGKITARSLLKIGVPLVAMLVLFSLVVGWDSIEARLEERDNLQARGNLASSTVQMIRAQPVAGFGLGTWRAVYPAYAHFDIFRLANEAHDDWLQWASDGGVPFALIVLFLAVWSSRYSWSHFWGIGVPIVFLHCLVDYPTREPALAAMLFTFAGALSATGLRQRGHDRSTPEWQVLSVRTATR